MKTEDLKGMMVMVSPVYWTSDYARQIGTIEFAGPGGDDIWVGFEDGAVETFSAKLLFILKSAAELKELAESKQESLWQPVIQNLQGLAWLLSTGSAKQLKNAFDLVQDDPELHRWATIRLNEALDLTSRKKMGR